MTPTSVMSGVYLITPDQTDTAALLATTAPLLAAGVALLQYRRHCRPCAPAMACRC